LFENITPKNLIKFLKKRAKKREDEISWGEGGEGSSNTHAVMTFSLEMHLTFLHPPPSIPPPLTPTPFLPAYSILPPYFIAII
jgi:hypothetical protein